MRGSWSAGEALGVVEEPEVELQVFGIVRDVYQIVLSQH